MNLKALISIALITLAQVSAALTLRPILSLDEAKIMADACEKYADSKGWRPVNIAVVDAGGNLQLFRRQDDAFLGSIEIAQLKARSSAKIPIPTRDLGDKVAFEKPSRPHGIQYVPGIVVFAGGLPIKTSDGKLVGAIGVSGATSDQDEECASIGINAIRGRLK